MNIQTIILQIVYQGVTLQVIFYLINYLIDDQLLNNDEIDSSENKNGNLFFENNRVLEEDDEIKKLV